MEPCLQRSGVAMRIDPRTSLPRDTERPPVVTRAVLIACLPMLIVASGCDKAESPTSPSSTTTTTSVASPTVTEEFVATVPVSGSRFYSFEVIENGTVNVTLVSVGGATVPSTVWMGLGIGTPSGEDCTTTSTVNTAAGSTAQVSGTYAPGIYCAKVLDIGNLFAPATVAVTIAHP
jgi:hypothetical protein